MSEERFWMDLQLHVLVRHEPEDSYVHFEVRQLMGENRYGKPIFELGTFAETPPFLTGTIKWDGCSDLHFTENKHFCGREDVVFLGKALERLYDVALEKMPSRGEYLT